MRTILSQHRNRLSSKIYHEVLRDKHIFFQMRAFREGFDRVFPLSTLRAYSPEEVQRLLSGEQCPEWSRDDILNFTEPKLGYTRESPGFLRFVDVMEALTAQERKNFLQFATGCSSLPPGNPSSFHFVFNMCFLQVVLLIFIRD